MDEILYKSKTNSYQTLTSRIMNWSSEPGYSLFQFYVSMFVKSVYIQNAKDVY